MKRIEKSLIDTELGSVGFFSPKEILISKLNYFGGLEEIDNKLTDSIFKDESLDILEVRPNGLLVEISMALFKKEYIAIPSEEFKFWTIESDSELFQNKDKSVVGRALLGGLLLGPIGAIVGGISGVGDKKVASKFNKAILSIFCESDNKENVLLFSVEPKNKDIVFNWLMKSYSTKYKKPEEINIKDDSSTTSSVADEILKLKKLLDDEILTQEEFESQKKKLLS